MRTLILLAMLLLPYAAEAAGQAVPAEVQRFIRERNVCEHFRGEPMEGDSPDQKERRKFVVDSLDIYCAGTDRRLSALKRRYRGHAAAMKLLNRYEEKTE